MYLNNAYFGQGVWGIQDASLKYFGVNASDLSVTQGAMLAGMLQSPNGYDPLNYPKNALNRRNQVLQNLVNDKKLSQTEADQYAATAIGATDHNVDNSNYNYPYFFDAVIDEAINKYGLTESEILNDGYKIYTTLNQTDQQNQLVEPNWWRFTSCVTGHGCENWWGTCRSRWTWGTRLPWLQPRNQHVSFTWFND